MGLAADLKRLDEGYRAQRRDLIAAIARDFIAALRELDPDDRALALQEVAGEFCVTCGAGTDKDGECLNGGH